MSLIEGVGDEVTVIVSILLAVFVFIVAWFSTHIRDIPFFSVIVVELTQRNAQRNQQPTPTQDTPTVDGVESNSVGDNGEQVTVTDNAEQGQDSSGQNIENTFSNGDEKSGSQETQLGRAADKVSENSPSTNNFEDFQNTNLLQSGQNEEVHEECVGGAVAGTGQVHQNGSHQESRGDNPHQESPTTIESETDDASDSENRINSENSLDSVNIAPEDLPVSSISSTELRNRRLAFFNRQSGSDSNTSTNENFVKDVPCERSAESEEIVTPCESVQSEPEHAEASSESRLESTSLPSDPARLESTSLPSDPASETGSPQIDHDSQHGAESGVEANAYVDINDGRMRIRLKYLNETQRNVVASPTDTIDQFRRANFAMELEENKLVRFIFNGQDLRNGASTLQAYNIVDNSVVHCLITQVNTGADQQAQQQVGTGAGLDIGIFMVPLFGLILCIIWYLRFMYKQYFNASSTLSLMGITFLFVAACISSARARVGRPHEHVE